MIMMKNKPARAASGQAWRVSPERAREIQVELRTHWESADRLPEIRLVAGLDASFELKESQALPKRTGSWSRLRRANRAIGCVVLYRYPEMEEVERAYAVLPLEFPYVPGLLSFREIPVLLRALAKLKQAPDLLFCDGHGYAHPRRMGLASHLGILLDTPAIGCAKSLLLGEYGRLAQGAGSSAPLRDPKAGGEVIGKAVRTRRGTHPIYVSQGHRVTLETAVRLTLAVSDGYRIPRPTRDADRFAGEIKRKLFRGQSSEK
jgi:deoxyribonuclease V